MKLTLNNRRLNRFAIAASLFALTSGSSLSAADQTWNNGASNFIWDTSALNWSGPSAWTNGNNATFSSTGEGAVTVNGTVSVGTLTLNSTANGSYSFSGGTLQHTLNTWTFNKGATISSAITATTLAGSQSANITTTANSDAGKLTITGPVTMAGTGSLNWFRPDGRFLFKDNTVTLTNVGLAAGYGSGGSTYTFDNSTVSITSEATSGSANRGFLLVSGTINVTNNSAITTPYAMISYGGTGALSISSGTFTTGKLEFNPYNGTNVGTLNLDGGTLALTELARLSNNPVGGNTTVNLNLNGGVMKALANNTKFINSSAGTTTNAKVMAGGAKIDTNGFNITIPVELVSGTAGDGGLLKSGLGALTLNRTNTYTGATTISAGTLVIASTGSIATSSQIDVGAGSTLNVSAVSGFSLASGQTLKGSGTVTGAMIVGSGATLAIGNSPGTMTFNNNLTLAAGSTSDFEINGLTAGLYDLAQGGAGSQTAAFGGTLNLVFQSGFNTVGTLKIFDFENYSGSFTSVNTSGLAGGYSASFDSLTGVVNVVPEPSTWALLSGGLTVMMVLRRRRR